MFRFFFARFDRRQLAWLLELTMSPGWLARFNSRTVRDNDCP